MPTGTVSIMVRLRRSLSNTCSERAYIGWNTRRLSWDSSNQTNAKPARAIAVAVSALLAIALTTSRQE